MNVLPVIARELRVQARHPATYRLRLVAVAAPLAASLLFLLGVEGEAQLGRPLFALLQTVLFYAALALVTFSVADCLSQERREGTLGLLLLTPLNAADIVIAKVAAHALRAGMLLLAVVPVFALPLLLGGVAWDQAVRGVLHCATAVLLALGGATLASAGSRRWTRALAAAAVLVVTGWLALTAGIGLLLFAPLARFNSNFSLAGSFDYSWLMGISFLNGGDLNRRWLVRPGPTIGHLGLASQVTLLALVWVFGAVAAAAWHIRRVWREEPPSARRQQVERLLTRPVLGVGFFHGWMRRLLARNPVGWLERRAWQSRLVMWAWLAIVMTVSTSALATATFYQSYHGLQQLLGWLLLFSIAMAVAGSFRRERETGVLELMLISPLSARCILWGRLLGIWGQFLPALLVFAVVWLAVASFLRGSELVPLTLVYLAGGFVALPLVGLYFSLRCRTFVGALLLGLTVGWVLPYCGAELLRVMLMEGWQLTALPGDEIPLAWAEALLKLLLQFGVAAACFHRTCRRLERRQFDFDRAPL
jgi:ABC-type transport system involved in multi-copper enzyme maturation permease subunit